MTADSIKNQNSADAEWPLTASFALNGPGYIEASAGTGKTFTITCLITRLLLGSKKYSPLPLDRMLVMTFTRSAARDLKRKIRERLTEVLNLFQDHEASGTSGPKQEMDPKRDLAAPDNSYLRDFVEIFHKWDLPESEIPPETLKIRNRTARLILRTALTSIDKASISTIHSFCSGMLKRHAISARIPFSQNLLTDDKASAKCTEAVMEAVREFFYDPALTREETGKLLEGSGIFSDDRWLDNLSGLLEGSYGPSHTMHRFTSPDGSLEKAATLAEVARIFLKQDAKLADYCDRLYEKYEEFFKLKFNQINKISDLLPAEYSTEKCVTFFRECTKDEKYRKNHGVLINCLESLVYGRSKAFKERFAALKAIPGFSSLINSIGEVLNSTQSIKNIVYDRILTRAAEILERKKDMEGFLFQDDLLTRLKAALENQNSGISGDNAVRDLRDAILKDYPVAIIDEFQDTDPVQFFIVSQVYLNYFREHREEVQRSSTAAPDTADKRQEIQGFYVIGDPKQSIYLFRGADVSCYNNAVAAINKFWAGSANSAGGMPGEIHNGNLDTNFRSNPLLVYQVNSLFSDFTNSFQRYRDDTAPLNKPNIDSEEDYFRSYLRGDSWHFAPVRANTEKPGREKASQKFLVLKYNFFDKDGKSCTKEVIPWPLTVFYDEFSVQQDSKSVKGVNKEILFSTLAASCAREIVNVLNWGWISERQPDNFAPSGKNPYHEVKLSDIAVLVSSKDEAGLIRRALARKEVPAVFTSNRQKITDTLEFESVYDLMQAFLNPKDNQKLRYLVSGSFFDWTAQDISDSLADGFEKISPVLVAGAEKWQESGFMSAYCYFTQELRIFENLSGIIGGEAIITNLNQAAEIAQSLSSRVSAREGMVSLYRRLMDEPENDGAAEELSDYSMRAGASDRVIRITTYHSSKGLEYNIVFMPFAGIWKNSGGNNSFSPVSYLEDSVPEGEGRLRYDITGDDRLRNQHDWNEMGETLRLWYVAATRAKYAMFLWTGFMNDRNQLINSSKGSSGIHYHYPLYVQFRSMAKNSTPAFDAISAALRELFCATDKRDTDQVPVSEHTGKCREYIKKLCCVNSWPGELADWKPAEVSDEKFKKEFDRVSDRLSFLMATLPKIDKEGKYFIPASPEDVKWDSVRKEKQLDISVGTEIAARSFDGNVPDYWRILSYSSLVGARTHHGGAVQADPEAGADEEETRDSEIAETEPVSRRDEPRNLIRGGISTGLFLHSIFEHLTFENIRADRKMLAELRKQDRVSRQDLLDSISTSRVIASCLEVYPMSGEWHTARGLQDLTEWILSACETPMQDCFGNTFALRDLRDFHTVKEMDFYMNVPAIENIGKLSDIVRKPEREDYPGKLIFADSRKEKGKEQSIISEAKVKGFLTGSLDLFFEYGDRYYVADYKSNIVHGNMDQPGFCDQKTMQQIIAESRYDFQYVIYTVAMHRFLRQKLGSAYSYEKHIGGIFYLFLRGMMGEPPEHTGRPESQGVCYVRLPESLVTEADRFFAGESAKNASGNGN